MNIADLVANLKLNTSQFTAGMQQATRSMQQWANSMTRTTAAANKSSASMAGGFKDVSRIVQGIFVSKAIYGTINAIKDATTAVGEFASSMEYAQMTYSNLFGSTALAEEFLNVLEDFSAVSPFQMGDIEKSTRMLKAYGIEAENLMYVTQGVLTAAAGQGNKQVIPQITRALGQIYTKGVLKAEEARQLAEAGIPVYKILQEKLGLTAKQLGELGKQSIPASKAINALVDGINERFGNLLEESALTMRGLVSNIQDNMLIIGEKVGEPVTRAMKGVLATIGNTISKLREVVTTQGVGGLFEAMIPPRLQQEVKTLIANIMILSNIIKNNLAATLKFISSLLPSIIQVLNTILGILNILGTVLNTVTQAVVNNATAMRILTGILVAGATAWLIWKAKALAALAAAALIKVFNGITTAIAMTTKALTILAMHPVWALLAVAGGIFFGLAASTNKWKDAMNGILGSFTKISGIDTNKLLLPSQKERAADLDKFNKKLGGTADSMDDLAKKTGKAAKAAAGLLGFDEVFKLPDPDESAGAGDLSGLLDDINGLDFDGALGGAFPSPGALSAWGKTFMDKLVAALAPYKDSVLAAGIGALLGAALGGLIGGPAGALIGAALGGLAGWLWSKLAEQLGLNNYEMIGIEIGAGIGAAIGWILGGPAGALIGAAIGGLVGWIGGLLVDGFVNNNWNWKHLSLAIGTGLGAAIGFVIGGPTGALIGAAVGSVVGWIGTLFVEGFETGKWDYVRIGTNIGAVLGMGIGAIIGGPGGAAIGIAVGAVVGYVGGKFVEGFQTGNWDIGGISKALGLGLGTAIGFIAGGPIGAVIGAAVGSCIGWIISLFADNWGSITTYFEQLWGGLNTFFTEQSNKGAELWDKMGTKMDDFFGPLKTKLDEGYNNISDWFDKTRDKTETSMNEILAPVNRLLTDLKNGINKFNADIFAAITKVWEDIKIGLGKVLTDIQTLFDMVWTGIKDIIELIMEIIALKIENTWTDIKNAVDKLQNQIKQIITDIWNQIWAFIGPTIQTIYDWITSKWEGLTKIVDEKTQATKKFLTEAWNNIKKFLDDTIGEIYRNVKQKFEDIYKAIREPIEKVVGDVNKFFGDMYTGIKNSLGDMYTATKNGVADIYKVFTQWLSDMWDNVFNKLFGWLDEGIQKIKDFLSAERDAEKAEKRSKSEKEDKPAKGDPGGGGGYVNSGPGASKKTTGHALGGVFNQEHWAPFAEGNKAEAIIPLENRSAMQPFTDAVSDNLLANLLPMVASMAGNNSNSGNNLRPLYVGTLVADARGLKELNRKMKIIDQQENTRGLN